MRRSVALTLMFLAVITAPLTARAQTRAEFEVSSVKPNTSGPGAFAINALPGGRFTATNVTVRALIQSAYGLQAVQITGGPGWLNTDRFDIVAKGEGGDPGRVPLMLRSLLADRFKLVVRAETRDAPIYALAVARSDGTLGADLHRAAVDCSADAAANAQNVVKAPPRQGSAAACGIRMGLGTLTVAGATLPQIAGSLSGILDRIVVDRTALAGTFTAALKWTPDQATPGMAQKAAFVPTIDPNGPSIFTAVREQLGLKLEATHGPLELLAIVSVERPTVD
jgi:uncharacterized protein (TIGR03435 family)